MKITNKESKADSNKRAKARKLRVEDKMSNKAFALFLLLWFFTASLIVYKTITL